MSFGDDYGWTYGDLAGELWAKGVDIEEVPSEFITASCSQPIPERAADEIARALDGAA